MNEETDSDLRGDVTFLMPDGITLENFQTANGWEKVDEVDGRQRITLSLESLTAGEEFTFSVKVSWWYVLSQIWIYPTIILSLIVWRVRLEERERSVSANWQLPQRQRSFQPVQVKAVYRILISLPSVRVMTLQQQVVALLICTVMTKI